MSPELAAAIKKTEVLFKTRDRAEDWGRNIIEASREINSMDDWTLFYSYLTNPNNFDPTQKIETLDVNAEIEGPPDGMKIETYKNGTDVDIVYTRILDDEKTE
jgi:hypothetical protein